MAPNIATFSSKLVTALVLAGLSAAQLGTAQAGPDAPAPSNARMAVAAGLADVIPDVAERTVKSVVSISTTRNMQNVGFDPNGFGIDQLDAIGSMPQAEGSGVIINATGRIVTNAHVLQGADDIKVALADGREFAATLVGMDERTDIAVLQLKGNLPKLTPLPIGDSEGLRLGEIVLAIGNPFGIGQSVSMGIISAKNRQIGIEGIEDFVQTDAAINPGNSGGALVNLRGELVGINTAIASKTNAGVGFAIPMSLLLPTMEMLVKDGKVTRAYLGVEPMTLSPELATGMQLSVKKGVILRNVVPAGPAARAGLANNDVIVAINGMPVATDRQLRQIIGTGKVGSKVQLEVVRGGKGTPQTVTPTLEVFPSEAKPQPRQRPTVRQRVMPLPTP